MKFRGLPFFLTCLAMFSILAVKAQVIINEISYNPPESGNDSLEYIELYNAGVSAVNLNGWHFTKGVVDTFPNVDLNGGGYYVIAIKAQAMHVVFGITVRQWTSGALSNSGESIILVDGGGNLVDSVAYKKVDPWPTEPNGMGPSLELIDHTLDNNDGANWQASGAGTGVIINGFEVKGTPGAENSSGGTGGPAVTIDLANFQFTPKNAVVKIGDVARWVNNDPVQHNVDGKKSAFPSNPADLYSGVPAAGPWQFDFTPSVAGLYDYKCDIHGLSGMVGTLGVYDPLTYTDFALRILRLTDGINGDHIYDGVPTTVTGVVHGINFLPTGYSFYIIQPDNVGINVFSTTPGAYTVQQGDLVKVSGVIHQFNGLLEIAPDAIDLMGTGNPLVSPWSTDVVTEDKEGSYLHTTSSSVDSVVATGASGFNLYIKQPSGIQMLIRVDADLGLDSAFLASFIGAEIYGVGTQFDPSFPWTSGYQLLMTQWGPSGGVHFIPQDNITMTPNPVADQLTFQSDLQIDRLELFSLDGKQMLAQPVKATTGSMNVRALAEGLYIVRAVTTDGIWTSKVMVEK
jgi:plastocyanin